MRTPSAGLPLDGDTRAGYLILRRRENGWSAEQRRVEYDLMGELTAFRQSDYYSEGGVIAQLFWEELRTARWWLVPFFSHLKQVSPSSESAPGVTDFDAAALRAAWHTFDHTQFPDYNPDATRNSI